VPFGPWSPFGNGAISLPVKVPTSVAPSKKLSML